MNPEALAAIATSTMRPSALDAATARDPEDGTKKVDGTSPENQRPLSPHTAKQPSTTSQSSTPKQPSTPSQPSTPFGEHTDGTQSAAKVVEEVVHSVKAAVGSAIAWAETKVEALNSESDRTGPYTSAATCVPSDLDPIASGIPLPAVTTQKEKEMDEHEQSEANREESGKTEEESEGGAGDGDGRAPP